MTLREKLTLAFLRFVLDVSSALLEKLEEVEVRREKRQDMPPPPDPDTVH